jgi:hypothetical protein
MLNMNETTRRVLRHIKGCHEAGDMEAAAKMLTEYDKIDPAGAEQINQYFLSNDTKPE